MEQQYLQGTEVLSKIPTQTQVYQATHEEGGKRLPFANRSFISFSYGGKVIEDFNLIAYTEGDSLSKNLFGNFEDKTETYDTVDGQLYWGTHFTNNELALNLVTDSIDDKTLDDFKEWFHPGAIRELILSEHPNRAIMARVAAPPIFSFMPFEKKVSKKIAGVLYDNISVTEYKGTIQITFVADEPYWYARYNLLLPEMHQEGVLGVIPVTMDRYLLQELIENNFNNRKIYVQHLYNDVPLLETLYNPSIIMDDSNGYWMIQGNVNDDNQTLKIFKYPEEVLSLSGSVITLNDDDFKKIILEDNIPHLNMINFQKDGSHLPELNALDGETKLDINFYLDSGETENENIIFGSNIVISDFDESTKVYNLGRDIILGLKPNRGAIIGNGFIGYDDKVVGNTIENLSPLDTKYLYYSGTAPSKPIIQFTFTPTWDEDEKYIIEPYVKMYGYSYLAIDDIKFYFTMPSLLTSYNQVISIIDNLKDTDDITILQQKIKEEVNDYYIRIWAGLVSQFVPVRSDGIIDNDFKEGFLHYIKYAVADGDALKPITVTFNSKNGEAVGKFKMPLVEKITPHLAETTEDENGETRLPLSDGTKGTFYLAPGKLIQQEGISEFVGDMVKSKYLIIEGRNYPDFDGFVTKKDCHKITTNYSKGLQNLSIYFKNMYY